MDVFRNAVGGRLHHVGAFDIQLVAVGEESVGIVFRDLHDGLVFPFGALDHLILAGIRIGGQMTHIGNIHHPLHRVTQIAQALFQHILHNIGAQIADVRIVVYRGAAGVHLDQVGVIGYEQLLLMRQRIIKIHLKLPPNLILHKITPLMPRGTRGGQSSRFHSHLSLDMHLSPLPDARSLTAPARAFSR